MAQTRHGAQEAAGEQAVDGRLADAEGEGGFLDGIGQAFHAFVGSCRGKRIVLRGHGVIVANYPAPEKNRR